MGIDVVHIFRVDLSVFQRHLERLCRTFAAGSGAGDVVGIAGGTAADDLSVDLRAARFCVFIFFQHQHTGAFTHHEAVAVFVEGTGGVERVVIAGTHGFHGAEPGETEFTDRRFRTAGDHHIRIAQLDGTDSINDPVGTACTGGNRRVVGALRAIHDSDLTACHVGDQHGDEEGAHAAGTAVQQNGTFPFKGMDPADPAADQHPDPVRINGAAFVAEIPGKSCIFNGFRGGGNSVQTIIVKTTSFFRVQIFLRFKAFDFARDLRLIVGGIKAGHSTDTATTVHQRIPHGSNIISNATDGAHSGNHNTFLFHGEFSP